MTASYILTAAAEADLRDIIRYTRKQWGDAQVRAYIGKLKRGIECIAAGQGNFKDMSALHPALRMVHCERHYIFCLLRVDAPALVLETFRRVFGPRVKALDSNAAVGVEEEAEDV